MLNFSTFKRELFKNNKENRITVHFLRPQSSNLTNANRLNRVFEVFFLYNYNQI